MYKLFSPSKVAVGIFAVALVHFIWAVVALYLNRDTYGTFVLPMSPSILMSFLLLSVAILSVEMKSVLDVVLFAMGGLWLFTINLGVLLWAVIAPNSNVEDWINFKVPFLIEWNYWTAFIFLIAAVQLILIPQKRPAWLDAAHILSGVGIFCVAIAAVMLAVRHIDTPLNLVYIAIYMAMLVAYFLGAFVLVSNVKQGVIDAYRSEASGKRRG